MATKVTLKNREDDSSSSVPFHQPLVFMSFSARGYWFHPPVLINLIDVTDMAADYLPLIFSFIFFVVTANTSEDEVSGSLSIPPLANSHFLPNQSPIFIGTNSEKSTIDDEYYYDGGPVESTAATRKNIDEPIETMPINPRTTMAPIPPFPHPNMSFTKSTETFATLLVNEVAFPGEKKKTTRPPLKLVRLNDGELIHQKRLRLQDPSPDGALIKQKKKIDWRPYWNKLFWQSVPTKRRTIVVKDIGEEPEDLPAFPPGAQLIHFVQKRIRLDSKNRK